MENNKNVTPMEGLKIVVNQLLNISVPVGYTEQISIPLSKAVNLLQQCIPFLIEKTPEQATEENVIDLVEIAKNKEVPEETEN